MSPTGYAPVDLDRAVAAAARAPVAERSQPWLRLRDGAIDVLVPPSRRPAGDRAGWAARLGGGAGLFNVRLALAVRGRPALVRLRPYRDEPDLLARLHPGPVRVPGPAERGLFAALPYCHVDTGPVVPAPVPPEVRRRLIDAGRTEHGWLDLIVGHAAVAAFAEIEAGAGRVLDRGRADAAAALRWRSGAPPSDLPTGWSDPAGPGGGRAGPGGGRAGWGSGVPALAEPDRESVAGPDQEPSDEPGHEPMVAVLGSPLDTPGDQLRAGQALQRVLLTAAAAGLTACLQAPVIAVPAAREQLRLALGRFGRPQMVLRIGQRPAHRGVPPTVADPDRRSREDGSEVPGTTGPPALPRPVGTGVEWR
ncbi:nitroreductase [Plantactinospora sp. KLBMP9567]|uniref:nitroreductase n=1 Tax=Plantactinospora sp. KLBMP9567 TaxID=3085900 RepID=UPI002981D297|nr:nitroreductase [Plantactinospora sp. KLBMP9567]MDW5325948.1 nitroreductase [Plantactinospora sp. KLBMP9567]